MALEYQFTPQEIIAQGRITESDLNTVRHYVEHLNQKPVPEKIQDEMLVLFLLSCENDVELTKRTIKAFYECKKDGPEIFDNRDMQSDEIQKAMNTMQVLLNFLKHA